MCTGAATSTTASSVTLAEGQNATCTITNTAIAPQLTLVKVVDAAAAGGTADADRLDADRDRTDEPSRAPPVTRPSPTPPCQVGDYALAETGGPAGYTPSAWSCVGGTPGTNMVTLAPGDAATCTITNTAVAPDAHAGQGR